MTLTPAATAVAWLWRRAAQALDRYLRARRQHPAAREPWLWIGQRGRLTDTGIEQVVKRRGRQAGVDVHPHAFRHTFAHLMLAEGMQEGDLMRLGGWQNRQMLDRYGSSGKDARAVAAYRDRAPGDKL